MAKAKASDITDRHAVELAAKWIDSEDIFLRQGIFEALRAEGYPVKVIIAKLQKLIRRGFLGCGTSIHYAWPTDKGRALIAGDCQPQALDGSGGP